MDSNIEYLPDAEFKAMQLLQDELKEHLNLAEFAHDTISLVLEHLPDKPIREVPLSVRVKINLLTRMFNDLRSASLLAQRGYALQAASLVSSICEVAYTVSTIADEEVAREWIEYGDPTRSFKDMKNMIRDALSRVAEKEGVDDSSLAKQVDIEYKVYRQLCLVKHANPILQSEHGFWEDDDNMGPLTGPDTCEEAVRVAWFALEHAAGFTFVALATFVQGNLSGLIPVQLWERIVEIGNRRKKLEAQAKQRWGTEDPFPGKW